MGTRAAETSWEVMIVTYVCVCVYIYIYIHKLMLVCMLMQLHKSVIIDAHVCMYACMYACMYVCMYVRMYVCSWLRTKSMKIDAHACMYVWTYGTYLGSYVWNLHIHIHCQFRKATDPHIGIYPCVYTHITPVHAYTQAYTQTALPQDTDSHLEPSVFIYVYTYMCSCTYHTQHPFMLIHKDAHKRQDLKDTNADIVYMHALHSHIYT
jgi:hypothetical protein